MVSRGAEWGGREAGGRRYLCDKVPIIDTRESGTTVGFSFSLPFRPEESIVGEFRYSEYCRSLMPSISQ
jgi:hypothetical protein